MAAALSRTFLLQWFNQLDIAIQRIEDLGKGSAICTLLKRLDESFPKFKEDPQNELDYMHNLKIVQVYMEKKGIRLFFPIERMCKCKMQDNLEVAQWFYKYWEKEKNLTNEFQTGNDQNYTQRSCESKLCSTSKSNKHPDQIENIPYREKQENYNDFYIDRITESNDQVLESKNSDYFSDIDVILNQSKTNEDLVIDKSINFINKDFIENIRINSMDNRNTEHYSHHNQNMPANESFMKNKSTNHFSLNHITENETNLHLEMINDLQEQLKFKDEKISKLKEVAKVFENERDYYFDKLVMIERVFKEDDISEILKNKIFSIMYEDECY